MNAQSDQPVESPERDRLGNLFALGAIFGVAIKSADYRLSETFKSALHLSNYGSDVYQMLTTSSKNADEGLLKAVLLCENYWTDMFYDHQKTDISLLGTEISQGLINGSLRLPFTHAGVLYRRANEIFPENKRTLDPAETSLLLKGTPQGVFQMRSYVSGPFGLLESRQKRNHQPIRGVPLFHCADPSCPAIHGAVLKENPGPIYNVHNDLRNILRQRAEAPMRIHSIYNKTSEDSDYYDDLYAADLIPLLGDAFSMTELRTILKAILDKRNGLRGRLARVMPEKNFGSSQQIVTDLGTAECLQLILLEDDRSIIGPLRCS